MKKFFYGLVLLGFLLFMYQQIINESKDGARIGVVLPLTGKLSFIGEPIQNGIELYRMEHNNTLEIIYEDSKGNAKDGLSAVTKLLNSDKVDYIVVNLTSVAMASKKIIKKHKNVVGLMLSTHPNMIDESSNLIRTFISGKQESEILFEYINKNNIDDIAIVYVDDSYGEGMAVYMDNLLKEKSKKSQKFSYSLSNLKFELIVQKLKEEKINNIILIGYGFEYSKFFQVLKSLEYNPFILSNLSFSNKKGQEIDNYKNTIVYDAPIFDLKEKQNEKIKEFIKNYQKQFQLTPDFNAAYGYDTIKIIDDIENKVFDKEKEITINGASGILTILPTGDSRTELELIQK